MPSSLSATQVAFLLVALVQAVFAVVWAIGAYALATARTAMLYWVTWAALSAVTWLFLSLNVEQPPLFAVLCGVIGAMALQRGIRSFTGLEQPDRAHAMFLLVALATSWFDMGRPGQAAMNYGVLASLYLFIAVDLYRHARDRLHFDWPVLLALPVLLGSLAYAARVVRAIVDPGSVVAVMATDSTMNVRAAMIFVALVLSLHATLLVLVVARLVGELRRLSRHDALTGLLNRRAMEEMLEAQIHRSRGKGETFALLMLDLDHFKRINDQYGHPVGDLALKHVAGLLSAAMPEPSVLARYGGEEFVAFYPRAALTPAGQLADRLRELLASSPLLYNSESIPLSVSIGVAQWRGQNDDLAQLLLRADAALFQAKVQGRNRVVVALEAQVTEPQPA